MTARVLYLDIETSPIVAHIWSLRDLNVGINQIVTDPEIIGVGYSWDGKPAKYISKWDDGSSQMLADTYDLLNEADVVVHYNGNGFDMPWLYGAFAREGWTPPSPVKNLDLYRIARKNFRFPSHKLQYVSTALGLEGKHQTGGHSLWMDCLNGDEKARAKMARYCKQDVNLLPKLLDRLRPWIGNQVNFSLYEDGEGCPKCGSLDAQKRGFAATATSRFQQYQCNNCSGWYRDTRRESGATKTGIA